MADPNEKGKNIFNSYRDKTRAAYNQLAQETGAAYDQLAQELEQILVEARECLLNNEELEASQADLQARLNASEEGEELAEQKLELVVSFLNVLEDARGGFQGFQRMMNRGCGHGRGRGAEGRNRGGGNGRGGGDGAGRGGGDDVAP